ncbi:MAG TPA: GNAT family N-acetyltransferase [Pyrinomonadaceae bacterium]|jgi:ribosomal protein S18 acetylase RimI-like enzyme
MKINLRAGRPEDAEVAGRICYEAFKTIAEKHNFPRDFPDVETAVGLTTMLLSRPDIYSVVAELDGEIVGSNFLWEGNQVSGVGPITIDPKVQDSSIGRRLMEDVIRRSDEKGFSSIRLIQAAYHNRSLSLYTKLGFNPNEPVSGIGGEALNIKIDGFDVRPMTESDLPEANDLTLKIHGHTRLQDLRDGIGQKSAFVVERHGRITGYTTALGIFGHTVGETNEDLKAIIGAAPAILGPGFLLPTRNAEVLRWCLENGLRIIQPMTLMSRGLYQEPRGAFMPSVLF